MLFQQLQRAHQEAGRAIAALETVAVAEGLLHGMQLAVFRHPLHGQNLATIGLESEYGAGLDAFAVQQDRAGAAVAGVAANVCAGQAELFAQQLHQQGPRFDFARVLLAIDLQRSLARVQFPQA